MKDMAQKCGSTVKNLKLGFSFKLSGGSSYTCIELRKKIVGKKSRWVFEYHGLFEKMTMTMTNTFRAFKERSLRLLTFETFDQSGEETRPDQ